MRKILFTLSILLSLLAACQEAPTLAPGEKLATLSVEIIGTWKGSVEGEEGFLIVREDGTATLAEFQDGTSGNTHEYQFEGDQFNIKSILALHNCEQVGKYQIRIKQDGDKTVSMVFVLIEDPCNPRIRDLMNNTSVWLPGSSPSISNEAIAGTYVVTLTGEQMTTAGANFHTATELKGTWQLEFTKDGMARFSQETRIGMRLRAEGPFILSADEIVFDSDTGDFACAEFGIEQGTYGWKLEGDQLILTITEDGCEHRGIIYSAQPWIKQP